MAKNRNVLKAPPKIESKAQYGFLFANIDKMSKKEGIKLRDKARGLSLKDLPDRSKKKYNGK